MSEVEADVRWLPPGPVLRRVLLTALVAWAIGRVAMAATGLLRVTPLGLVALSVVAVSLTWVGLRVNRERTLLANLAVSPVLIMGVAVLVTLVLEVAIALTVYPRLPGLSTEPLLRWW